VDSQALIQSDLDHVWHHVMPMHEVAESGPKVIVRGEGSLVWDVEGKEYLDAMGGIYTTPIGHGRADVIEAICEQGRKLEFYPNFQFYTTPPVIELAEKLTALYPADMKRWFFCSGGSEAMDTALKIARQYWKQSGKPGKHKFIALRGGFHGVTFGAASATGITLYREPYEPLVPGFRHVPAPFCYRCPCKEAYPGCCLKCVDALEQQIVFEHPDTVAAFIAEPVLNPIGEVPPPVEYYQRVRELCDRYQVLFLFDEVITGFGRTGKWFGCEHYGVKPDLVTFAKGITSGYQPCGAVGVPEWIDQAFWGPDKTGFMHGHTFGGHPMACVAALKNIEILESENLVALGAERADYLFQQLQRLHEHRVMGDIRGKGMLIGMDLVRNKETKEKYPPEIRVGIRIRERAWELGLICRDQRDVLVIAPPLVTTKEQCDRIVDTLDRAIGEVEATTPV